MNIEPRGESSMVLNAELLHIGFGNHLAMNRVIAIVSPGSAPTKRLIQEGKAGNMVIDMTNGRRTKAVLVMDSGHIVLAAINPETVAGRLVASRSGNSRPSLESFALP